jgi:hypothetical protein
VYSNDAEKKARWDETVVWAKKNILDSVLQHLRPEQFYYVAEITTYEVGPLGGPMYLPWNIDSKPKPSPRVATEAIASLRDNWNFVVGDELAAATRPLRLTGVKGRRLLVVADPNVRPPWGSWRQLPHSEARRTFTKFRAAINGFLHPLAVDHIDFVHVDSP